MAPLFSPPLNPLAATQVADTFRLFNIQQIQPALGYFNYSRSPPIRSSNVEMLFGFNDIFLVIFPVESLVSLCPIRRHISLPPL